MISITNKADCCGCGACANVCPNNSIAMIADEEGFLYPNVGDTCIKCGKCLKVCPTINVDSTEDEKLQAAYLVQNKDSNVISRSTSGGAFTAIAEYVLNHNGVVFGAVYDRTQHVHHTYVKTIERLNKFQGSKYVQSKIGFSYKKIKSLLDEGVMVCFSGTPCQVEGLKSYLSKRYINLITVDIVCHAVPSPKIFDKYIDYIETKNKIKTKDIRFRDKSFYGYQYSQIAFYDDNATCFYHAGIATDPFLRAFFSDICDRPSCYECKFKKRYRNSDFTLWDCFNVNDFDKQFNINLGTTRVLIHSNLGRAIFEQLKPEFIWSKVTPDTLVSNVKELTASISKNRFREVFFTDANEMDGEQLFKKYYPVKIRNKVENVIRILGTKTGTIHMIKKITKKVIRNYKRK